MKFFCTTLQSVLKDPVRERDKSTINEKCFVAENSVQLKNCNTIVFLRLYHIVKSRLDYGFF